MRYYLAIFFFILSVSGYSQYTPLAGGTFNSTNDLYTRSGYPYVNSNVAGLRGGPFMWDALSTGTPDSGIVFKPNGITTGRWIRQGVNAYINVQWFGAVPDSSTICDVAIQRAVLAAQNFGINQIFFPAGKAYLTTSTVKIPNNISVFMDAPVIYRGSANIAAMVIGDSTLRTNDQNYRLYAFRETQSDWTSEENIGIRLLNIFSSNSILVTESSNFTIGVQLMGINGIGCAYNKTINLGRIVNNKYGIDLRRGGASGYVNENIILGGRFAVNSNVHNGEERMGVRISSVDVGVSNNNMFFSPSFELSGTNALPNRALPVLIEAGQTTAFYDCRDEGNFSVSNKTFIQTSGTSQANTVEIGYTNSIVDTVNYLDLGIYRNTKVSKRVNNSYDDSYNAFYVSGDLSKRVNPYNSTNFWFPAELNAYTTAGALAFTTNFTLGNGYLGTTSARGVGVRVSTNQAKRLIVKKSVINNYPGRVYFRCYDANMNELYTVSPDTVYAAGTLLNKLVASGSFGGAYTTNGDFETNVFADILDTVKLVDVIVAGGTDSLKLKGFTIQSMSGKASIVQVKTSMGQIATQIPTTGTWDVGTVFWNPSSTTVMGYKCRIAGSPGTWDTLYIPPAASAVIANQNLSAQAANFWISQTGQMNNLITNTARIGGGTAMTLPNNSGVSVTPQLTDILTANVAMIGVGVQDGVRNRRFGIGVDDTSAVRDYGLYTSFGSDTRSFHFRTPTLTYWTETSDGKFGLLGQTSPTAYIDITGSTNGIASARIRPGVNVNLPNNGDLWYDTTASVPQLSFRLGNTTVALNNTISRAVDTIYRVNDSTLGYTILGSAYTVQIMGRSGIGGGGGGTVTAVNTNNGSGITGGPINTSGTIGADTANILSTKAYRQKGIDSLALVSQSLYAPLTRNLSNGYGILPIGNLTADRTVSADTFALQTRARGLKLQDSLAAVNAATYALLTTQMIAGVGLIGGGTIAANRTFNVDTSGTIASKAWVTNNFTGGGGVTGQQIKDSILALSVLNRTSSDPIQSGGTNLSGKLISATLQTKSLVDSAASFFAMVDSSGNFYRSAPVSISAYNLIGTGSSSGLPAPVSAIDSNYMATGFHTSGYYYGLFAPLNRSMAMANIIGNNPVATRLLFVGTDGSLQSRNLLNVDSTNIRLGIGIAAPAVTLQPLSTTEQFRPSYDASNYMSVTVGSTGTTTFDLAGTSPVFVFNKAIQSNSTSTNGNQWWGSPISAFATTSSKFGAGGVSNTFMRGAVAGGTTNPTLSAGYNYSAFNISDNLFTEAGTSAHNLATSLLVGSLTGVNGAGATNYMVTAYFKTPLSASNAVTPAVASYGIWTEAKIREDLGSDATGDQVYRGSDGGHVRFGIGTAGQRVGVVSGVPAYEYSYLPTTTATDANTTISAVGQWYILPAITANRNLVMPAGTVNGQELRVWNKNTSGNNWTFTTTTVVDAAGSTITNLTASTSYLLMWDGANTRWVKVN